MSIFATMKKISQDKKNSIVNLLQAGYSITHVSKRLSVSLGTVSNIRTKRLPTLQRQPAGRPRILSILDKNGIKRKLLSGLLQTGVGVYKHVRDGGVNISYRTILRNLREIGFQSKKKVKKPFISAKHRRAQLNWARQHRHWTVDD